MPDTTTIEWVVALARATGRDARVWNPLRGCLPASPGCTNCWAALVAAMRAKNPNAKINGRHVGLTTPNGKAFNGTCRTTDEWNLPLLIRRPSVFFVCSESDLFFAGHDDEAVDKIFDVIAAAPRHLFLILTKRAERLPQFFSRPSFGREVAVFNWPLPNVWLGVSVEDQQRADERIPQLLAAPAAVRFLSCEPLLGPVDIDRWLNIVWQCQGCLGYFPGRHREICPDCGREGFWCGSHAFNGRGRKPNKVVPPQSGRGIDWVIAGGESGPKARPMYPDWARSLRDQCAAANVPFMFKQWGEWAPGENVERQSGVVATAILEDDEENVEWFFSRENLSRCDGHRDDEPDLYRVGKQAAGRLLDGAEHNALPGVTDAEASA